jgi:hypothetical protein
VNNIGAEFSKVVTTVNVLSQTLCLLALIELLGSKSSDQVKRRRHLSGTGNETLSGWFLSTARLWMVFARLHFVIHLNDLESTSSKLRETFFSSL